MVDTEFLRDMLYPLIPVQVYLMFNDWFLSLLIT